MKVAFIPLAGAIISLGMASATELPSRDDSSLKDVNYPHSRFKAWTHGVVRDEKMLLADSTASALRDARKALKRYSRALFEEQNGVLREMPYL
jgi:hypothetical protein